MSFRVVLRVLGVLLMIFSFTLIPPSLVSVFYADGVTSAFILAFVVTLLTGLLIWFPVHNVRRDLRTRDGFIVTVMFWVVLGLFGAIPFYVAEAPGLSLTDSVFESLSGLTTTGATVITGIDALPKSILFYRQQLQWLGGMGIIVLAVAILPMLGIGGMQLYRAETPGPIKDSKLTPRIKETAATLWYIYVWLTVICAVSYWVAGMDWFDAISHSFSTIAIGGFSTHDASIGYFQNHAIEAVCILFMVISGVNFSLHFTAWRIKRIRTYLSDPEFQFYIGMLTTSSAITVIMLFQTGTYGLQDSVMQGIFEVVSIATTTGFGTADFSAWPSFLPIMLFLGSFVGACAGSTGGGLKVIRVLLIFKQGIRELKRLIHPNALVPVKVGKQVISDRVLESVWGLFSTFVFLFVLMMLMLMATGLNFVTAFSAVSACMNNLGPGLGDVAAHYGDISATAKWILCFAMLLGRLELFTLLVLLMPEFWRR